MSDEILDPGTLRYRMSLQAAEDAPDGAGGAARGWAEVQQFWGGLRPISVRRDAADGSLEQRVTHELIFRDGPELNTARRLSFNGRLFNILGVRDASADGSVKLAMIEEVTA